MKNMLKIGTYAMKALLLVAMLLITIGATATFAQVSGDDLIGIIAGALTAVSLTVGVILGSVLGKQMHASFTAQSRCRQLDAEYYEACQDCQA